MVQLSAAQACEFYGDQSETERSKRLCSGPIIALEIVGPNPTENLKFLLGSGEAGPAYLSSSDRSAEVEQKFIFDNPSLRSTAQFNHCTVCVIKPHIVQAGKVGQVIESILNRGFEISAMEMFNLDKEATAEFLEVYKTVVPEYNGLVEQFSSGACVALEVRGPGDVVTDFRNFTGPTDPEVARLIRKESLRAMFGDDKIKNGVHCTDLTEDGVLEAEFFFSILQKKGN